LPNLKVNRKLQYHFNRLEAIKEEALALSESLSAVDLEFSPNGKWSAGQILTHILTSERLALQYMKKKLLGVNELSNAGFIQPIKLVVLKISQRLPVKYKVPEGIRINTPAFAGKEQLLKSWDEERRHLHTFLSAIKEENTDKLIFKHPIAGMFSAAQGLEFLREHIIHHMPQIARIVKAKKTA
jgi:hypothetical protein